jgi:cell division protein FtsB
MNKRRKKKRRFRLKHLILLIMIFGISKTLISQRIMMKDLTKEKLEEENQVAQLEKEIKELNEEIKDKDSLEFVEKVAREDLRMVKPREIIYIDKNKDKNHFKNFRKK